MYVASSISANNFSPSDLVILPIKVLVMVEIVNLLSLISGTLVLIGLLLQKIKSYSKFAPDNTVLPSV